MDIGTLVDVLKDGWLLYSIAKEILHQLNRKSSKPESKRRNRKRKGKKS